VNQLSRSALLLELREDALPDTLLLLPLQLSTSLRFKELELVDYGYLHKLSLTVLELTHSSETLVATEEIFQTRSVTPL
jgi:hypothetical protein